MASRRTDTASRIIRASPAAIYRAFAESDAWISWLPPEGMKGRIAEFDFRVGGRYRLELTYADADHTAAGKTSENSDVVKGRFIALSPDKRVVQVVEFDSNDPAFAGEMTMTWALQPVPDGTEVTFTCDDVPKGIRPEDHERGLRSTLANLATFTESPNSN